MALAYQIWDVFTDTPLSGNPLAIVWDTIGLPLSRMQAVAGEFNLSETVFVGEPPEGADASLRIFTPRTELPFAGHPTVGTSVALGGDGGALTLSVPAGLVHARVDGGRAALDAPIVPSFLPGAPGVEAAGPLGLTPGDIGFDGIALPAVATSGPSFTVVPVKDVEALSSIKVNEAALTEVFGESHSQVFAVTPVEDGYRARMFAPLFGVAEDPATGAASVAFAAVVAPSDGLPKRRFTIHQGVEMGRPSQIEIAYEVNAGALSRVELSGSAVCIARGELLL
ncbi:MAG: PhzF family phenazine biosynthesis protein [Pseudomonadota bacterium]